MKKECNNKNHDFCKLDKELDEMVVDEHWYREEDYKKKKKIKNCNCKHDEYPWNILCECKCHKMKLIKRTLLEVFLVSFNTRSVSN